MCIFKNIKKTNDGDNYVVIKGKTRGAQNRDGDLDFVTGGSIWYSAFIHGVWLDDSLRINNCGF